MTAPAKVQGPATTVDVEQAAQYIEALTGSRDSAVTWCLLHDKKAKGARPVTMYGTLAEHQARLVAQNKGGYGVFVTVNEVKPSQRRVRDNIIGVRALFVESDHGAMKDPSLAPSFVVQSARGQHVYWKLQPGEALALFEPAQKQLAAHFESDPAVHDLPRLMRVPGFCHHKGEPFLVGFFSGGGEAYSIGDVLKAHPANFEQIKKSNAGKRQREVRNWGPPVIHSGALPDMDKRKSRAEAYLSKMPPAIEGEGGDCHTYRVACALMRDFMLDADDAMDVLRPWNASCVPPWDEDELSAKLDHALQHGKGVFGSKLFDRLRPGTDPNYLQSVVDAAEVTDVANVEDDATKVANENATSKAVHVVDADAMATEGPDNGAAKPRANDKHTGAADTDDLDGAGAADAAKDDGAPVPDEAFTLLEPATEDGATMLDQDAPCELSHGADAELGGEGMTAGDGCVHDDEFAAAMEEMGAGPPSNEDETPPYHLQIVTMIAQNPAQLLGPEVVERLASLQRSDRFEYVACMEEVKKGTRGMLQNLKNAIKRHASSEESEVQKAAKIPITQTFPEAEKVISSEHLPPYAFTVDWSGVSMLMEKKDADGIPQLSKISISGGPILISRCADKLDSSGTLLELAFRTRENGQWHKLMACRETVMTARLLNTLAAQRLPVHSGNTANLVQYLAAYETVNEKVIPRCAAATQMGWQGDNRALGFLVGRRQISPKGKHKKAIEFATDGDGDAQLVDSFRQKGKWEAWRDTMVTMMNYPRVHVGVLASLSAPLLKLLGLPNYMLEYSGETSCGKTTAARFAGSVWGATGHDYSIMRSWNTTQVGMERAAALVSGLPMIIDESNEAQTVYERQVLAKLVYQLVNGRGRSRATRSANVQPLKTWSTVIISTGEHPITGNTQDAGTRARVLAIEDSPFGGANDQTGIDVDLANLTSSTHYGHAGPRFVQWLVDNLGCTKAWQERHAQLVATFEQDTAMPPGVNKRLFSHLALLELTGELIHDALDLPGAYISPVRCCVGGVMQSARDVDKPKDALIELISLAYSQRARFFGASNFDPTMGCIGKRKVDTGGVKCLALTSHFVRTAMTSYEHNLHRMNRAWVEKHWLLSGPDGKATRIVRVDDDALRCYCVPESVVEELMPNLPNEPSYPEEEPVF